MRLKDTDATANSVDSDLLQEQSDLGLHCLLRFTCICPNIQILGENFISIITDNTTDYYFDDGDQFDDDKDDKQSSNASPTKTIQLEDDGFVLPNTKQHFLLLKVMVWRFFSLHHESLTYKCIPRLHLICPT